MWRFAEKTRGCPLIMGRRTWDSLPVQPLPGRPNIVLTRNWPGFSGPVTGLGCDIVKSVDEAIKAAGDYAAERAFVIGGGEIYRAFLPLVNKIYLTKVDLEIPDADAYFPYPLPEDAWDERLATVMGARVWQGSGIIMSFYTYSRRKRLNVTSREDPGRPAGQA
jgi:dihydrofolate reductase